MGHRYQRLYDSPISLESALQVVLIQKCIDDSQYSHQVKQAKNGLDEERLASLTPVDEEKDCGAKSELMEGQWFKEKIEEQRMKLQEITPNYLNMEKEFS